MSGARWVKVREPGMTGSGQSCEDPMQDGGMNMGVSGASQDLT